MMEREKVIPLIGLKVNLHFAARAQSKTEDVKIIDVGEKYIVGPAASMGDGPKLFQLDDVEKITHMQEQVVE